MEQLVREIRAELATPPILVFPNWDPVGDGSRPFDVYCDACTNWLGAAIEQEQSDGSMNPIAYISRAMLDSERHWTPLDLEAGSIVWAIKRRRVYIWGNSAYSPTTRHWKAQSKWGTAMHESSGGPSSSLRSTTQSSAAKAARTATPTSCHACQSLPWSMSGVDRRASPPLRMAVSLPHKGLRATHSVLADPGYRLRWASAPH